MSTSELNIFYPPFKNVTSIAEKPRIVQQLKSETVISGQPVIFVCMVEGNPSPRVQWTTIQLQCRKLAARCHAGRHQKNS
ncbi:hypothetical protein ACTXT7_003598 [Hymenolepis weldensis]